MVDRAKINSPVELLRKANARDEIGYAYSDRPGANDDLLFLEDCLHREWIVYSHDASVGTGIFRGVVPYQRRDIFVLTDAGRAALAHAAAFC